MARLALASLWCSQATRIMADNALRVYIVLLAARTAAADAADAAWGLAGALYVLPALFLAPINGALSNSLPRRRVLILSAAYCLAVPIVFTLLDVAHPWSGWWLWCLALAAVGNAIYSPTRYGMLPAAAHDSHIPLTTVNGWIEMGSGAAILAGFVLGGELFDVAAPFGGPVATIVLGILFLYATAFVTALPVSFPSDAHRPEPLQRAIGGFFRDCRRILSQRQTRGCLLALAALRGLVLSSAGPIIAVYLEQAAESGETLDPITTFAWIGALVGLGFAVGSLLAGLQWHPTRILGLVPFATAGFALGLAAAAIFQAGPWWLCLWIGAMAGIINVPLFTAYQMALPSDARGNGMAVLNATGYLCMTVAALTMHTLAQTHALSPIGRLWIIVLAAGTGVFFAWRYLLRDAWEQLLEIPFRIMYKVTGHGEGFEEVPISGPMLVVANHAAYFDPVWLACVLPRRLTGMLTSEIFDIPVMRFLGTHVVPVIRVEHRYRREAPELTEAIAALDRGEAVLIFPEGQMRKREDWSLHPFGRGVWHILKERPETPVLVCWIEGGWGSYVSYYNGFPTRNKHLDFRRPIDVAIRAPEVLSADLLADHRATRNYLMRTCAEARRILGLEPVALKEQNLAEPALAKDDRPE
jgi:1-acyl-sn-glycerol-3-phosphate acyltransferase